MSTPQLIPGNSNQNQTPITTQQQDNLPAPAKKRKFGSMFLAAVMGGLVTACAGLGAYHFMHTDKGYVVEDANVVMEQQTNPKLKASSTDKKSVYKIENATDTLNGLTFTVEGIQFRRDQTRLWVHVKNDGKNDVMSMLAANARIVDNKGHQYEADPFASWQGTEMPVGMDETVLLVFDPIRDEAGKLTFLVKDIMNMKDANWNAEIDFDIPN